jgi:hypothetical protein
MTMAMLDLSRVTSTLGEVLRRNITASIDPTLNPAVSISTLPPERITGGANVLNLYLYHISADTHFRNLPPEAVAPVPVQTTPMALVLYYIVTAHHLVQSEFDTISEQRLLGYALKTFHDFPVITDTTIVGSTQVMPQTLHGRDNRLQITLRQVTPEEALNFWSAEQRLTARPSAYYDVRFIMLEPEPPQRLPGVVLSLGSYVIDMASIQIGSSRSLIPYTLPASMGSAPMTIEASPARVGPPVAGLADSNRFELLGVNLTLGRSRTLLLRNRRWERIAPEQPRVPVDFALNTGFGWTATFATDRATFTIGDRIRVVRPDGTGPILDLFPGLYAASIDAQRDVTSPSGATRSMTERSNEVTFAVIPRITGHAIDGATGRVTFQLGGTYRLNIGLLAADPPGTPSLDIQLALGGVTHGLIDDFAGDPSDAGSFVIAADGRSATLQPSNDLTLPGMYPVRLIVEGAESQPYWVDLS